MFLNRLTKKKDYLFLIAVFYVGIVIKLLLWDRTPYLSRDSVLYLNHIRIWVEEGAESYYDTIKEGFTFPLYFYLVNTISKAGLPSETSALLINILLGSIIPVTLFFLSLELFGSKKNAYVCAIIALFHPEINTLSIEAQRDIGYLFFICIFGILFLQYFRQKKTSKLVASGFILSCAIFFRVEALEFYPIICFLFFLYAIRKKKGRPLVDLVFFFFVSIISLYFLFVLTGMRCKDLKNIYNYYYVKEFVL